MNSPFEIWTPSFVIPRYQSGKTISAQARAVRARKQHGSLKQWAIAFGRLAALNPKLVERR